MGGGRGLNIGGEVECVSLQLSIGDGRMLQVVEQHLDLREEKTRLYEYSFCWNNLRLDEGENNHSGFYDRNITTNIFFFNMEADMAHELAAVMCFALKYLNFYIYFYIFTIYRADKLLLT